MRPASSAIRSLPRVLVGRFAVALAVVLPLVVSGIIGVNVFIDKKIESIPRVKLNTAQDTDPGAPANFVLIGSDSRAFVSTPEERQAFGDPGEHNSDTLMVVHVDPRAKTGFLVSFPRDLAVDIPGMGQSKINAAYDQGPQKVIDTLKQDFNIPIQHYLEVDFESFQGIVDAMGGVPVYIDAPSRDEKSGFEFIPFNFHPGCYTLDGAQALGYVRSRTMEQYLDGKWQVTGQDAPDLHRIERQQTFLRRIATEAFRQSVNSPLKANEIADKALPKLKADDSLSRSDINKLIRTFRKVDPNDPNSLQMVTLPTQVGATTKALGATLELKQPDADAVLARLRDFGPTPTQQPGPKPSQIRVRVFNGSGKSGVATQAGTELRRQGFVTVGVANQSRVNATQVRYRPGSQDKAKVVRTYLGGVGTLIADKSIPEADVAVVLGKDFKAIAAPAGAAPPDTTTAPANTPGSAPATTSPNGRGKQQAPPANPTQC